MLVQSVSEKESGCTRITPHVSAAGESCPVLVICHVGERLSNTSQIAFNECPYRLRWFVSIKGNVFIR